MASLEKPPNKNSIFFGNAKRKLCWQIQTIKERFEEVGQLIVCGGGPGRLLADIDKYANLTQRITKDLEKVVKIYDEYDLVTQNLGQFQKKFWIRKKDAEFREMAKSLN